MTGGEICERCQMAASAGTLRDHPDLTAHLRECAECRKFAEFTARIMACAPVIPERIPTLADIRGAIHRRRLMVRVAWPLSLAAAAALMVGAVLAWPGRPLPVDERAYIGGLVESVQLENSDYQLSMTWDSVSDGETALKNSLAAARGAGDWNIEAFNPVAEEL